MLENKQFNFLQEEANVKVLKSESNGEEVVGSSEKDYNMNKI
jgi:hypothetical protein